MLARSLAAGLLSAASPGQGPSFVVPRRGVMRDFRKSFEILRDRPVGPYKKLAPGVKDQGRVGEGGNYRRIVHYPKDGKYTIKPLTITKLGGRDPVTGRKVIEGVGGGAKQKFRWVDWHRLPLDRDPEGPDLVERVINLRYDPCRESILALVGQGRQLRWMVATENMKEGQLVVTSGKIPKIPVKPVEGNSYPLGALPVGTIVCQVQREPRVEDSMMYRAEHYGTILRKEGKKVIVKHAELKADFSYDQRCQCVVGKVSIHPLKKMQIGSPQRLRWLGYRPRSGLWQRKTGRMGRKIKKPPPVRDAAPKTIEKNYKILLTDHGQGRRGMPKLVKQKFNLALW